MRKQRMRKIMHFIAIGAILMNIYGCVALLAGTAAGAGTAAWLSGKLTQEFNASYDRTINAAERALKSLNLEVTKISKTEDVAQVRSQYTDGKEIWIDIRKVTDSSTKVEVRVGAVKADTEASTKILKRIQTYL